MRISEVIKVLKDAQKKHGDVELEYQGDDGRSSWIGTYKPKVVLHEPWPAKKPFYELVQDGY